MREKLKVQLSEKTMSILSTTLDWIFKSKKARDENNEWIKNRMKLGHKLFAVVPPEATWWPPREIIKKNPDALQFYKPKRHLSLVDNTKE